MLCEISHISSVQFGHSVVSDSLQPHEPQHARPPCPSPTPGVHPNPCPLSRWCHPAISSSVVLFSSCPQSFPVSGFFQMSQLFASGGQSIGVSASTSVLPMNTHDWCTLGWAGWISLQSKALARVFSNTTVQKHQFFGAQLSSQSNSHIYTWPLESALSFIEFLFSFFYCIYFCSVISFLLLTLSFLFLASWDVELLVWDFYFSGRHLLIWTFLLELLLLHPIDACIDGMFYFHFHLSRYFWFLHWLIGCSVAYYLISPFLNFPVFFL